MWLYRGAQSAVFYYATCTPCASSVDRRKRRKDAARSQREKEKLDAIVTDQPRPFPQPTPFSTNQGWMEEITLGPGPPARRGGLRNTHRRTDSWNTDAQSANSANDVPRTGGSAQKKDKGSLMQPVSDRWNRMRYQREDEPLWGQEVEVKGSSVGLSGRGRTDVKEPSKYYIARVPPVNDLHPPIVSGPKSRAETRWMLQPPPSAKVMAGKERTSASVRTSCYQKFSPAGERNYQLPPISAQNTERKTLNPSPTLTSSIDPEPSTTGKTKMEDQLIQPPSQAVSSYGCDESNFVISTSVQFQCDSSILSTDSELESPRASMHSPQTPISRPGSKDTEGYAKHFRPAISKTLSTGPRDNQKVQLLHLEINEPHEEVGLGQFKPIRPWRWSMDI